MLAVTKNISLDTPSTMTVFINDTYVGGDGSQGTSGPSAFVSLIIPPGATYRVDGGFTTWFELR